MMFVRLTVLCFYIISAAAETVDEIEAELSQEYSPCSSFDNLTCAKWRERNKAKLKPNRLLFSTMTELTSKTYEILEEEVKKLPPSTDGLLGKLKLAYEKCKGKDSKENEQKAFEAAVAKVGGMPLAGIKSQQNGPRTFFYRLGNFMRRFNSIESGIAMLSYEPLSDFTLNIKTNKIPSPKKWIGKLFPEYAKKYKSDKAINKQIDEQESIVKIWNECLGAKEQGWYELQPQYLVKREMLFHLIRGLTNDLLIKKSLVDKEYRMTVPASLLECYTPKVFKNFSSEALQNLLGLAVKAALMKSKSRCMETLDTNMPIATQFLLSSYIFQRKSEIKIYQIGYEVRNAYVKMLLKTSTFADHPSAKRSWLRLLAEMRRRLSFFKVDMPSFAINSVSTKAHFTSSYSWASILERLNVAYLDDMIRWFNTPWLMQDHVQTGTLNAEYTPSDNLFRVYTPLLLASDFGEDTPFLYNMARIGFAIGHEIGHAFDATSYQETYGTNDEVYATSRKDEFKCFVDAANEDCLFFGLEKKCTLGKEQLEESYADALGLRAAYDAMKEILRYTDEKRVHSKKNHTPEELFFYSFGLNACALLHNKIVDYFESDHQMPGVREFTALRNFGEFHKTFKCKKGDNYFPAKHCLALGFP